MGSFPFRCAASGVFYSEIHKFAESLAKTVALSLHHSCRSELTRQGISSYLRTVIVTAAVHRGFSSGFVALRQQIPCFKLPAPGRCHPLYVVFDLAESCVFVKQSQSAFRCGRLGL